NRLEGITGFKLTSTAQVTVTQGHVFGGVFGGFSLRPQCDDPSTDLDCRTDASTMFTRLLAPGTYFVAIGGASFPTIDIEPPWPTPSNTSCASPSVLVPGAQALLEDRIVSGGNRYYTVTTTRTGLAVSASVSSLWGGATITVRTDCALGPDLGMGDVFASQIQ